MEAFGVVAEAEGGVAKLKSLVLSLAVKGKLVHQDQADQSASQLLAHAAEMRSRLISDGLAARGKLPSPPIEEDHLFAVPAGWLWTRIGIISDVAGGLQKSPRRDPKSNHYPYLRVANVQRGFLDLSEIARFELEPDELRRFALQPGDLLVVEGNGSESEIGRCALWDGSIQNCIHQNHIIRCRPLGVTPEFVLLFLNSPYGTKQMKALAVTTSGLYNLSVGKIKDVLVPLPPVVEQQRIVAKVDQLMAMLYDLEQRQEKKRTAAIHVSKASLDSLVNAEDPEQLARAWERVSKNLDVVALSDLGDTNSRLPELRHALVRLGLSGRLTRRCQSDGRVDDLLDEVAKNRYLRLKPSKKSSPVPAESVSNDADGLPLIPEGWCWTRLEHLADHIVDGTHHTPTYVEEGVCFISATNIKNRRIIFDGCRRITEMQYQELARRCAPKRGDVLITKSGTLGEVAVVDDDRSFTLFESVALVPVLSPILPEYIAYCAEVACAGEFGKTTERGVAVKHLHLRDLRRMPIPLPPVEEQARIIGVLGSLMALVDCLGDRVAARNSCSRRFADVWLGSI